VEDNVIIRTLTISVSNMYTSYETNFLKDFEKIHNVIRADSKYIVTLSNKFYIESKIIFVYYFNEYFFHFRICLISVKPFMKCNKRLTSIRYKNMFTDIHFQVSSFGYECHFDTKENGKILTAKLDGHLTKRWLRGVTPKLSIFSFSWGDTLRNERVLELTTRFLRHEQISAKIKIQKIKNLSWLTSPELPEALESPLRKPQC